MTADDLDRAPVVLAGVAIGCALVVVLALWLFELFQEWVGVVLERMSMPIPGVDQAPGAREQWPRAALEEGINRGALRQQVDVLRIGAGETKGE